MRMESRTITTKQLIILLTFNITATLFLSEPRILVRTSGHTGWLCIILAMLGFAAFGYLLLAVIRRMDSSRYCLFEYIHQSLGAATGRIFSVLFVLAPVLLMHSFTNRVISELIVLFVLPETPREIILIMTLMLQYALIGGGIVAVARWSQLIMPFVVLMVCLIYALAIPNCEFSRLLPLYDSTAFQLFNGSLFIFNGYCESIALLFFWRTVRNRERLPVSLAYVNIWAGSLLIVTFVVANATMGNGYVRRMVFPILEVIRDISLLNSIQHLELFALLFWMFIALSKGSFLLYCCCEGTRSWFRIEHYKSIRTPICLLSYLLALLPQNLLDSVIYFETFKSIVSPPYVMFLLLSLWLMGVFRKRSLSV